MTTPIQDDAVSNVYTFAIPKGTNKKVLKKIEGEKAKRPGK